MHLRNKDIILVAVLTLLFFAASIIGWILIHEVVLLFSLTAILGLLLTSQIEILRRMQHQFIESQKDYQQIESLFYLFSTLKFKHPLPPTRNWAISPDFANIIISLIRERRPRLVVEAGSGLSTLVTAYCLQENGIGRVVSLDNDEQFASRSAANVLKHGLQDIASIIHAPLKEYVIQDKKWRNYTGDQATGNG
jgi:hypothetical protein